jgi:hypothetical protein
MECGQRIGYRDWTEHLRACALSTVLCPYHEFIQKHQAILQSWKAVLPVQCAWKGSRSDLEQHLKQGNCTACVQLAEFLWDGFQQRIQKDHDSPSHPTSQSSANAVPTFASDNCFPASMSTGVGIQVEQTAMERADAPISDAPSLSIPIVHSVVPIASDSSSVSDCAEREIADDTSRSKRQKVSKPESSVLPSSTSPSASSPALSSSSSSSRRSSQQRFFPELATVLTRLLRSIGRDVLHRAGPIGKSKQDLVEYLRLHCTEANNQELTRCYAEDPEKLMRTITRAVSCQQFYRFVNGHIISLHKL